MNPVHESQTHVSRPPRKARAGAPLRAARAAALLQLIDARIAHDRDRGHGPCVTLETLLAATVQRDRVWPSEWTRRTVETALGDLVERGDVRLVSQSGTIVIERASLAAAG